MLTNTVHDATFAEPVPFRHPIELGVQHHTTKTFIVKEVKA